MRIFHLSATRGEGPAAITNRVRRLVSAGIAIAPALGLLGSACPPATATADFKNLERYQSNFGVYDAPQFGLGDVLVLDTLTKMGARVFTVVPQRGDSTLSPPIDSAAIASDVAVNVTVNASVKPADVERVQAAISSYVSSHTAFYLKKFRRVNLTDPVLRLNAGPHAAEIRQRIAANPTQVYLIVQGVVTADDAEFRVADSSGVSASATVLQSGSYSVKVMT